MSDNPNAYCATLHAAAIVLVLSCVGLDSQAIAYDRGRVYVWAYVGHLSFPARNQKALERFRTLMQGWTLVPSGKKVRESITD